MVNSNTKVAMGGAKGYDSGTSMSQGWQLVLCGVPRVEFAQGALRDSLQHFFGENSEQLPANVQSLKDSAVFVRTL